MNIKDFDNHEMYDLFRSEDMMDNKRKAFNISYYPRTGNLCLIVHHWKINDSRSAIRKRFDDLEEAIEYYNSLT